MSAAQTMEAVSTPVSTLMVLMSVSVEVATDCPAMEELALVCRLGFEVVTPIPNFIIILQLQISMSAHRGHTTVIKSVLTLLAPSPAPVTVASHWPLMDDRVQKRADVEVH